MPLLHERWSLIFESRGDVISLQTYVNRVETGPAVKLYKDCGLSWLGVEKVAVCNRRNLDLLQ